MEQVGNKYGTVKGTNSFVEICVVSPLLTRTYDELTQLIQSDNPYIHFN